MMGQEVEDSSRRRRRRSSATPWIPSSIAMCPAFEKKHHHLAEAAAAAAATTTPPQPASNQPQLIGESQLAFIAFLTMSMVLYVTAIFIIFSITRQFIYKLLSDMVTECTTPGCREQKNFISQISQSVSPCTNFHRYVCEGWNRAHRTTFAAHLFETHMEANTRQLSNIPMHNENRTAIQKAVHLYRSCSESTALTDMEKFIKFLNSERVTPLDEVTISRPIEHLIMWTVKYNLFFYLSVTLRTREKVPVVYVTLRRQLQGCVWRPGKLSTTLNIRTIDNIKKLFNITKPMWDSLEIDNLERMLISSVQGSDDCNLGTDHPLLVREKTETNRFKYGETFVFITSSLTQIMITPADVYASMSALKFLENLLELDITQQNLFLKITALRAFMPHIFLEYLEEYGPDNKRMQCLYIAHQLMGNALSAEYFRNIVSDNSTKQINIIKENIVNQVVRDIHDSTVLQSQDKEQLVRIILGLDTLLGYSNDRFSSSNLEKMYRKLPHNATGFQTPYLLMASYTSRPDFTTYDGRGSLFNYPEALSVGAKIFIPPQMMVQPMIDSDGCDTYAYGTVGNIITERISHAFFDHQIIMSATTRNELTRLTSCYNNSYTMFGNQATKKVGIEYALPEHGLADFLGTQSLYRAAIAFGRQTLPGLTQRRLYFIARCVPFCGQDLDAVQAMHGTDAKRCNVPLLHLKEFQETFECTSGSPMAPFPNQRCGFL